MIVVPKTTKKKYNQLEEASEAIYSSCSLPQAPSCHILTDLTVMPRVSPSPQVGSHSAAESQNAHWALVAPSSQGLPPILSL